MAMNEMLMLEVQAALENRARNEELQPTTIALQGSASGHGQDNRELEASLSVGVPPTIISEQPEESTLVVEDPFTDATSRDLATAALVFELKTMSLGPVRMSNSMS